MNIFGSFTFGSLIKTFLPGIVWLLAICMLEADIAKIRNTEAFIVSFLQTNEQASLVLAFPAAIFLGLISNILVFMGLNDWLVRNPVKKLNPNLLLQYNDFETRIRDRCIRTFSIPDKDKTDFADNTDVEFIMLAEVDQQKLTYVREQYWYHMEFQMNLFLSLFPLFIGISINVWQNSDCYEALFFKGTILLLPFAVFTRLLLMAARKNYKRHVSKMLSFMVGFLCSKQGPESGT